MEKMLAAIFEGEGRLSLKEVPIPKIVKEDDVLIKVESASICGSDIRILEVPPQHPANLNIVLGHEFGGRVEKLGDEVSHLTVGNRVVVAPNVYCGYCDYCRLGLPNMCENLNSIGVYQDGAFAEYVRVPAKQVYKIREEVPSEEIIFCEPLSCIINATQKVRLHPGENYVVLGAGPIGLQFIQILKAAGAGKIIVSEISEFRQKFARDCGADLVVNPKSENLEKIVLDITKIGADVVFDAVGQLLDIALNLVRKGGSIISFGVNETANITVPQFRITHEEIKIIGSFIDNATFLPAIKLVESGVLHLKSLVTHNLKLSEIHKGIELMRKGECIKVVVKP